MQSPCAHAVGWFARADSACAFVVSLCLLVLACLHAEGPAEVSVAVYDASMDGQEKAPQAAVIKTILKDAGVKVTAVGSLKLPALLPHGVVILPDDSMGKEGGAGLGGDVPAFIESGGGVLFCAQGARCIGGGYPPASIDPLIPSICSFAADLNFLKDSGTLLRGKPPEVAYKLVPAGKHPITEGITEILPANADRWKGPVDNFALLKTGPDGENVLTHADYPFYAAVAAGKLGGGRAAFSGIRYIFQFPQPASEEDIDAASADKPKMEKDREKLLLNTVRWLGQPPDADRRASHAQKQVKLVGETVARQKNDLLRAEERLLALAKDCPSVAEDKTLQECLAEVKKAKEGPADVTWTGDFLASAGASQEKAAQGFLKCRQATDEMRRGTVALLRRVSDVRCALYEQAGKRPPRQLPLYPRGMFHMKYSIDEALDGGEAHVARVAEKFMRELGQELHANMDAGYVCDARAPGQYNLNRTMLDPYSAFGEIYGVTFSLWSTDPTAAGLDKTNPFRLYARYPALVSFMWDEPICYQGKGNYSHVWPNAEEHLRAFLKRQYKPEELKKYLIDPDTVSLASVIDLNAANAEELLGKAPQYAALATMEERKKYAQALWMMAGEYFRDEMKTYLAKSIAVMKEADPSVKSWINVNIFPWYSYGASLLASGEIAEIVSCDPYRNGSLLEMLMMEMVRGAASGPVWGVVFSGTEYTWEMRYRLHLYNIVLTSDGVFCFAFDSMYKHQQGFGSGRPGWGDGFWDITAEVYQNIEKAEQYLAGRKSIAPAAILLSERTQWGRYFAGWGGGMPGRRYEQTVLSLYHDFLASHVPVDVIWAERLPNADLSRYAFILAPMASCIQEGERKVIEDWVRKGGVLLATGPTSACDSYGNFAPDFAWKDVFQASRQKTEAFDPKVVEKGQTGMTVVAEHPILGSLKKDARIIYKGNEREVVTALPGAVTLAKWEDGSPGLLVSEVGQGAVVYTSATFFGVEPKYDQYTWEDGPMPAGTRELLDGCVAYALKKRGIPPPIVLEPVSEDLIADLRRQEADGDSRFVLQLLQRSPAYVVDMKKAPRGLGWKCSSLPAECLVPQPHAGVKVKVSLPGDLSQRGVKVVDPLNDRDIACQTAGPEVSFEVPPFVQYSIAVIECKRP